MRICSISGCGGRHKGRGYCYRHWKRLKRHGDPLGGRRTPGQTRPFIEAAVVSETDECIEWPFAKSDGYGFIRLPDGTTTNAHRLVCRLSHGEAPSEGLQAAHSCGNRGCCNPRHIRWATAHENAADKHLHGTVCRGEDNPFSRLTEPEVLAIREMRARGTAVRAISELFGIDSSYVGRIARGKVWAHLPLSQETTQ